MKHFISLLTLLFLVSCSKDKEPEIKQEYKINDFKISQNITQVQFDYETVGTFKEFTISYDVAGDNNSGGLGKTINTEEQNQDIKTLSELNIEFGNKYAFYIQGLYNENEKTDWYGPVYLDLGFLCESPHDLDLTTKKGATFKWKVDNNTYKAYSFEVQYDEQGFELGTGAMIEVEGTQTTDFQMLIGRTYDVYVRGNCKGNVGWSDWSGPVSIKAKRNVNACIEPEIVKVEVVTPTSNNLEKFVSLDWKDPGNNKEYEYTFTESGQSINPNLITKTENKSFYSAGNGFTEGLLYDFYVRTICLDGSTTNWVSKTFLYE